MIDVLILAACFFTNAPNFDIITSGQAVSVAYAQPALRVGAAVTTTQGRVYE
jgi:hypothetical protein